jgi:predicted DNA-binding protein
MAKQDDFVRITVRMPPELYERLRTSARATSINAEIVERLSRTFEKDGADMDWVSSEALHRMEVSLAELKQLMELSGLLPRKNP